MAPWDILLCLAKTTEIRVESIMGKRSLFAAALEPRGRETDSPPVSLRCSRFFPAAVGSASRTLVPMEHGLMYESIAIAEMEKGCNPAITGVTAIVRCEVYTGWMFEACMPLGPLVAS